MSSNFLFTSRSIELPLSVQKVKEKVQDASCRYTMRVRRNGHSNVYTERLSRFRTNLFELIQVTFILLISFIYIEIDESPEILQSNKQTLNHTMIFVCFLVLGHNMNDQHFYIFLSRYFEFYVYACYSLCNIWSNL